MSVNYIYILSSNGELYHHGVKGMKWGVRKDSQRTVTIRGRKVPVGRVPNRMIDYDHDKFLESKHGKKLAAAAERHANKTRDELEKPGKPDKSKRSRAVSTIAGIAGAGLGVAGVIGGAATGNPVLAFGSMGSLYINAVLSTRLIHI